MAHTLTENRVLQNSKHPFLTVRNPKYLNQSFWTDGDAQTFSVQLGSICSDRGSLISIFFKLMHLFKLKPSWRFLNLLTFFVNLKWVTLWVLVWAFRVCLFFYRLNAWYFFIRPAVCRCLFESCMITPGLWKAAWLLLTCSSSAGTEILLPNTRPPVFCNGVCKRRRGKPFKNLTNVHLLYIFYKSVMSYF